MLSVRVVVEPASQRTKIEMKLLLSLQESPRERSGNLVGFVGTAGRRVITRINAVSLPLRKMTHQRRVPTKEE